MNFKYRLPYLFLWMLLSVATALPAQQAAFSEFALGVRQGYQFSRINFQSTTVGVPQGLRPGFSSGLVLQYLSQKQLGFQMELNYSQRGWSAPFLGQPVEYRREMDFLEIPFLTHFAIGKKSFRIVLNAGSYVSFLLNEKLNYFGGTEQSYFRDSLSNRWSYGVMGGVGFALRTKIGVFQIEGRGALGFTDFFSVTESSFSASPEQFFGGQFAYLYRFGQKKATPVAPILENIPENTPTDADPTDNL